MAAPVAALSAIDAVQGASAQTGGAIAYLMKALNHPVYEDTRTVVRTWTEVDKKGKVHTLTETKTKGWTVSVGLLFGGGLLLMLWEVGLSVSKAVNSLLPGGSTNTGQDALDILFAPEVIAYDAASNVAGWIQSGTNKLWSWVNDGGAPTHSGPPPNTARTATVPATAMAAINETVRQLFGPVATTAGGIGGQLSARIAQATQQPSPTG